MCPSLWLFFPMSLFIATESHSYYYFINKSKTWADAESYCKQNHTGLATVWELSDVQGLNCTDAWIGLYNKHNGGYNSIHRKWHWSLSGVEPRQPPVQWSPPEPNDRNGTENCVFMYRDVTFADDSCCNRRSFICYNRLANTAELISDKKTWLEALHFCRQTYTDLLSGLDQINDDPTLKGKITLSNSTEWWVGLYRDPWAWTHSDSSFRNWHESYTLLCEDPSLSFNRCAKLGEGNKWMSDNCEKEHPFICYEDNLVLIRENLSWEEALDYCRQKYSDLVSITSEAQQRQVQEKAKEAHSQYVWLGSHFTCFLELWRWANGEFLVYENWNNIEASEFNQSAAMERGGGNKWFKKNQQERYNFLCTVK